MDELNALLLSRVWVTRRVDRIEFLDLKTVRRTISLSIDPRRLRRFGVMSDAVPLGWFAPWANAGASLQDADGRLLPYLTSAESDRIVRRLLVERLRALHLAERHAACLPTISGHRRDPGMPGTDCPSCRDHRCDDPDLGSSQWGCPATLSLLTDLRDIAKSSTHSKREQDDAEDFARIVLAWQTNFVLFARVRWSPDDEPTILRLSYAEELQPWERPWEERARQRVKPDMALEERRDCRKRISRGGPFALDLDELLPRGIRGFLATRRRRSLRKAGQRGLGCVWHVAWHQASGLDVASQQVDVILPSELIAVRMRMLRTHHGTRTATRADQVGAQATIVAPASEDDGDPSTLTGSRSSPTLFSLVIAQRSWASWLSGFWIALLTGLATLACAIADVSRLHAGRAAIVATVLVVVPALVSAVLAVRAGSDIADELTLTPRRLLGSLAAIAALCAASLALHPIPVWLCWAWAVAGALELAIAVTLLVGATYIRRLVAASQRPTPRRVAPVCPGKVLNPDGGYPRIPPPDLWLQADEGDLVPWGWLTGSVRDRSTHAHDRAFWRDHCRGPLISWVREDLFSFTITPACSAPCPDCPR